MSWDSRPSAAGTAGFDFSREVLIELHALPDQIYDASMCAVRAAEDLLIAERNCESLRSRRYLDAVQNGDGHFLAGHRANAANDVVQARTARDAAKIERQRQEIESARQRDRLKMLLTLCERGLLATAVGPPGVVDGPLAGPQPAPRTRSWTGSSE